MTAIAYEDSLIAPDAPSTLEGYAEVVRIARELGDEVAECAALTHKGNVHLRIGDVDAAERDFTAAMRIGDKLGERHAQANAKSGLAMVAFRHGRLTDTADHLRSARLYYLEVGAVLGPLKVLCDLGDQQMHAGMTELAAQTFSELVEHARSVGNEPWLADALSREALLHARTDRALAHARATEALAIIGDSPSPLAAKLRELIAEIGDPQA